MMSQRKKDIVKENYRVTFPNNYCCQIRSYLVFFTLKLAYKDVTIEPV